MKKAYHGKELIGSFDTFDEALDFIYDYLKKETPNRRHLRQWIDNEGVIWIDYGSHSNFLKVVSEDE